MPTTEQLRGRLIDKLKELFQLDQPDLDFGFYRIMHARAKQITDFITTDLLKIVENAFGQVDDVTKRKLKAEYDQELKNAKDYGAPEPENVLKVKEAKAKYEAASHTENTEGEIYDHLYRFFERYYDNGDFLSLRYYTRETSDKAAPYAIPYNGEEVKLHWANSDQYYIKTAEYFTNFTFDLRLAVKKQQELSDKNKKGHKQMDLLTFTEATTSILTHMALKVNFRIIEATEGEHGNIKAGNSIKRFFIIHKNNPVEFNKDGELIVNFEYRPDTEKTGQEKTWRDKRNDEAVETIFKELKTTKDTKSAEYLRLLEFPAPTEKNKKRSLLAKYVNQYTARNTCDYFIHKNLGGFLRRELDFYIKNEVMRLDDIENADVPTVESYLTKIRILRKISHKIIDFLAQLEDFQKKLWLKKKFVVETNYCITLDRISEELYPEIADNEAQRKEWVKLFAIDEIKGDLHSQKYSKPLTVKFLKENQFLVLDTRFSDEEFKERLIASIDDFDEQCDGLLIHSENFQALNLLQERYREQVKCVYIDPPYNTTASEIIYKNSYKHSSWISLIADRLENSKGMLAKDGIYQVAIDDEENYQLKLLLDNVLGEENYVSSISIQHNPRGRADAMHISPSHEYLHLYAKTYERLQTNQLLQTKEELGNKYSKSDGDSAYRELPFKRSGSNSRRSDRRNLFYPLYYSPSLNKLSLEKEDGGYIEILPLDSNGEERVWRWGPSKATSLFSSEFIVKKNGNGGYTVNVKDRMKNTIKPKSFWYGPKYDASSHGTMLLKGLFNNPDFSYPKSINAVYDALFIGSNDDSFILDYFAGSGTTAHAVINLNREDNGRRKYILVEMGDYFDTVLKPRIQKVIYSESWKNGKPTARHTGVSHCFKYLRLESYEDTLNNLSFNNNSQAYQHNPDLYEDYMLRYVLDVETRGSQSLLNIDAFADPCAYKLKVKQPGSDEYVVKNVDLLETFNYLIGLRVVHITTPLAFTAKFKREPDPELPKNKQTRLVVDGRIKQDKNGPWWFRKVEGWMPSDPRNPNNGQKEKVLIVWRKLTGDLEQDNLMLDEWFQKNRISTRDFEFDTIYVNESNNLPNLKLKNENWKVRLIEEEFSIKMWDMEEV